MDIPYEGKAGITIDFAWALAMAAGSKPIVGAISGRANGYVGTSATSGKAIRATTYTPQGANAQRSLSSTSASDTAAGTGAQQAVVNYLDASFVLHQEVVTLNGTTPVNTVGVNLAYDENMAVGQVGSGGGNVGTIQLWTATAGGGSVWASMAAGDNQTAYAHHYVPTGTTCYLLSVKGGSLVTVGQVNINHSGNPSSTNIPQLQVGPTIVHPVGDSRDHTFAVPLAFVGPDLLWLTTKPNAVTADTSYGHFDYIQF